jgi:DNA-binding NarL/FixJ family response regulator
VLVDDERLIRAALGQSLSESGIELVGEAANGEDAIAIVVDVRPDVVLMDLRLPGLSGVEAIQQLALLAPAARILVLTRSEQNRVVEAIVAGASGYILKSAPPEAIISAVRATAAGESVLSPQIAGKLLQRIRELDIPIKNNDSAAIAIRAALTDRELDILNASPAGRAIPRSRASFHSVRTRSPTTSPAFWPSSTSRTASRPRSKPYGAASPDADASSPRSLLRPCNVIRIRAGTAGSVGGRAILRA